MSARNDSVRGEGGFALPATLLAVLSMVAISSILVTVAVAEIGATTRSRDFESAVHAAEAGVDQTLSEVARNQVLTATRTPAVISWPPPQGEKEWALAQAAAAPSSDRIESPNGWTIGLRPTITGVPADFVLGVGAVEGPYGLDRRVLKVQFEPGEYSPGHAILADGGLQLASPASVQGEAGSVHSNGSQTLSSSPVVDQGATTATSPASGSFVDGNGVSQPVQVTDPEPVPPIGFQTIYQERLEPEHSGSYAWGDWFDRPAGTSARTYAGKWFDMCFRNGETYATVEVPMDPGPGGSPVAPCSRAQPHDGVYLYMPRVNCNDATETETVVNGRVYATLFRGWHPHPDLWHICHDVTDGTIFYAQGQGPIKITDEGFNDPRRITIISSAGIDLKGERNWAPALDDYLLQGEKDVQISGNQTLSGVVASQGSVCLGVGGCNTGGGPGGPGAQAGCIDLQGAVISRNRTPMPDDSPTGSPTRIGGCVDITYDGGAVVPLEGAVRIAAWNEL